MSPLSPTHRTKVLHQIFSRKIPWLLGLSACLTSVILLIAMTKILNSGLCQAPIVDTTNGISAGAKQHASLYLRPVATSQMNSPNLTTFIPFSPSSKINIWDLFVPEASCTDLSRVGSVGDGGKFACGLNFLRDMHRAAQHDAMHSPPRCVIYSYGVSTDSSFEVDVLRGGFPCEVHAFDPTIGAMNIPPPTDLPPGSSITFHKLGLSAASGSSKDFMLVESLLDTMHRLNHSFLDVLKIDVEGAEWDLLPHLLGIPQGDRGRRTGPVFGQLLVELHYQSVSRVVDFFRSLASNGFVSFSREINLQPCVIGKMPLAVEYSFIHPEAFFDTHRRHLSAPSPVTPAYHKPINAIIYFLTQKKRTKMMAGALQGLFENFVKQFPQYPVLIFHDDLDAEAENFLQRAVPLMPLTFVPLTFSVPSALQTPPLPERLPCSPHSSTIGYRHMIRFHATLIHQFLFDPANGYHHVEFMLRLDDDSVLSSPIGYDMFLLMRENELDFGFVNTVQDDEKCVQGLWNHSLRFAQKNAGLVPPSNMKHFLKWKEGLVIYNNFELSRTSIWKTPLWRKYISSIDRSGGIYLKRWGDAPLHTLYVLLGLPVSRMHAFVDIAYRHDPFARQVASGLPRPRSDPFAREDRCVYYDRWRCGNMTNGTSNESMIVSHGPLHPQWSRDKALRTPAATAPSRSSEPMLRLLNTVAQEKKVIYTFAHSYRTRVLADTILSFFFNYAKTWTCGFVVFHLPSFDESCIREVRSYWSEHGVLAEVRFVDVSHYASVHGYYNYTLSSTPSLSVDHPSCGTGDPEIFMASRFMISDAGKILKSIGFEWFFRIGDDSKLAQPVSHDIFNRLNQAGKQYGFSKLIRDNEACLGDLWPTATRLCREQEGGCVSLLEKWPPGIVVMTDFEVSHYTVLESSVFKRVSQLAERAVVSGGVERRWGDAALHTVGMLAHMQQSEVEWLGDVTYSARMNTRGIALERPEALSRTSSALNKDLVVSSPSLPGLNKLFQPQRFGWLGGDVSVSCALPSHADIEAYGHGLRVNSSDNRIPPVRRFVWMFGDSMIGTSSSSRRLEAEMVSNSVAIVDINPEETNTTKRIDKVTYFWGCGGDDGQPTSIFSEADIFAAFSRITTHHKNLHSIPIDQGDSVRFWPFSALAISPRPFNLDLKLLVVGQLVQHAGAGGSIPEVLSEAMGGLSFEEVSSVAAVVSNPHDPPNMWKTTPLILNFSSEYGNRFRWTSMLTLGNEGTFASGEEFVYVLCSYDDSDKKPSVFDVLLQDRTEYTTVLRIQANLFVEGDFSSVETLDLDPLRPGSDVQWKSVISVLESGSKPFAVLPHALTEPNFFYDFKRKLFSIVSLEMSDSSVSVCRAKEIAGPFECVQSSAVRPPADSGLISYAAKAHPELSHRDADVSEGLVVSYIVNTANGPSELFRDDHSRDLYVPLFLRVQDHPAGVHRNSTKGHRISRRKGRSGGISSKKTYDRHQ